MCNCYLTMDYYVAILLSLVTWDIINVLKKKQAYLLQGSISLGKKF